MVEGFEDTNCPLCGNFDPEPWVAHLADAAIEWRLAELAGKGTDNGELYGVRKFADMLIAHRAALAGKEGE